MTRDEARAYFKEKGLTYDYITRTDLDLLAAMLNVHIVKHRRERLNAGETPYWVRVHPGILPRKDGGGGWTEEGGLVYSFITAKGETFTTRPAVSFSRDGHIGLCGGVSDEDAAPILEAFVEWVDVLAVEMEVGVNYGDCEMD